MKTIYQLRKENFKCRVTHERFYKNGLKILSMSRFTAEKLGYNTKFLLCKGGKTTIQVTTPDGKITGEGISECSMNDNFSKKLGNSIALGRALKILGI